MSNYTYTHNVDTCACGNCHKSRVDAGTQDAYLARVRAKAQEVLEHEHKPEEVLSHKPFVCQCAKCKGYTAAIKGAADPKAIFAGLGTPFDSKCPHGLPFYACMPCSH
jgi:hypothetical protein